MNKRLVEIIEREKNYFWNIIDKENERRGRIEVEEVENSSFRGGGILKIPAASCSKAL